MMKRNYTNIILASLLILMAASARVVNAEMHLYNLAPVAALGLFSGAVVKDRKVAFLLAILSQFFADAYFQLFTGTPGFYDASQLFTYGGLIMATFLGTRMQQVKPLNVVLFTISASTLFFIISNFGVWVAGWYGHSFAGLVHTYVMGLPFFKNTLLGDMAGSVLLFGSYTLLQQALTSKAQKA